MKLIHASDQRIEGSGVVMRHLNAFHQVAMAENTVLAIRPVSPYAHDYLDKGCPTKPFCLKAKTVKDGGPFSGTVPEKVKYGAPKFSQSNAKEYTESMTEAQKQDSGLKFMPFSMEKKRLDEMAKANKDMEIRELPANAGREVSYEVTWMKDGYERKVFARKYGSGDNLHFFDENNEAIKVMGKLVNVDEAHSKREYRVVTADYDLMVVCPPTKDMDYSQKDYAALSTQSGLRRTKSKSNLLSPSSIPLRPREESTTGGNWTARIKGIVESLNNVIFRDGANNRVKEDASKVVHHNMLFGNPYADAIENNLPAIVILPEPMSLSEFNKPGEESSSNSNNNNNQEEQKSAFIQVDTPAELKQVIEVVRAKGYNWPAHEKYKQVAPPFSEQQQAAAQEVIARMKERMAEMRSEDPKTDENMIANQEGVKNDQNDSNLQI